MTFTLTIELGNDAMQTYGDLAHVLHNMAGQFDLVPFTPISEYGERFKIWDANGNTVGKWEVTK